MAAQKKAVYEPPSSQVDLANRLENGNESNAVLSTSDAAVERQAKREEEAGEDTGRPMTVEGNDVSGYIGVDPIYANYANETEAPLAASEKEGKDNPENALIAAGAGQLPTHSWEISDETKAKFNDDGTVSGADDEDDEPAVPELPTPNSADNPK